MEQLGWLIASLPSSDWDGLLRYYRIVWKKVGRPDPGHHEAWLSLVEK